MPNYDFICLKCERPFERFLRISENSAPQTCPECGGAAEKQVSATSFVLKGDAWPGKAIQVRGQMERKNRRLDAKMRERPSPATLAPNVDGERTETWADAQKLAKDKGKDTSSYVPLVEKERKARRS